MCVSLRVTDLETLSERLESSLETGADLAELRLDYLPPADLDGLRASISGIEDGLILTCRPSHQGGVAKTGPEGRAERLKKMIQLRPGLVDVELDLAEEHPNLLEEARSNGTLVIASWHFLHDTPDGETLLETASRALSLGDIAKVVTKAEEFRDNLKILRLYFEHPQSRDRLLAFAMGELGLVSRVESVRLGAPFMYVSLGGLKTAPGQIGLMEAIQFFREVGEPRETRC